ncbi:MAG TPA: DUF349 domain-containing protein [Bacteroidales bacterium]|nr:DUF349 domain-containing protein [Bacteroidales bacterium]
METKDLQNSEPVENEQDKNQNVNSEKLKTSEGNTPEENLGDEPKQEDKMPDEEVKNTEASSDVEFTEDEEGVDETEEPSVSLANNYKLDIDYNKFSREDLVTELKGLIENKPINDIRREVEAIKSSFYKKQKLLNEQKRKEFLNAGGNIDDFIAEEDHIEVELKDLFKRYRRYKAEYNRELEKDKFGNLEKKYAIIEELKELVNKDESLGDTFNTFRELQRKWKETGPVPQQKLKDLWNTYHHHVEKFYDYVNINKELRDLDLKKNLEIKNELCEKAEKLLEDNSVVTAFKSLQKLHNQWREVGPVPNSDKETVWERFKEATRLINKKHQDYFKSLKDNQKDNLARKEKLCEQAEQIASKELGSHKEWTDQTEAILNLQKEWRTIGFAPKKDNNRIYNRFRNACDKFFGHKRDFYAQNKELQDDNLKLKIEICEKAESMQESTDWKKTTNDLINLQKQWKDVGPVSRKQSDKVWKRFRAACDYFFNRKSQYYGNIEQEYEQNLKKKKEIIEQVKNYKLSEDSKENFEALKKLQEDFMAIGFVPYKLKDKIQNEFNETFNKIFEKLDLDEADMKLLKFQTKLESIQHKPKSVVKIRHEREKCFNKIRKLESDIAVWENNIGFFNSDSEDAKNMLKDYKEKIEKARQEIIVLEEKVRMIDKTDKE